MADALPSIKPPKKTSEMHRVADPDTGTMVEGRIPVRPKGKAPGTGNRLMWRINPVDKTELQVKWNRKTSDWMTHSMYEDRAGCRLALSIVTRSAWKTKPQAGTISRAKAG